MRGASPFSGSARDAHMGASGVYASPVEDLLRKSGGGAATFFIKKPPLCKGRWHGTAVPVGL